MATAMYSCSKCLWASHLKYLLELDFVGLFCGWICNCIYDIQDSYFARSDILKYLPSCHISIPLTAWQEAALL